MNLLNLKIRAASRFNFFLYIGNAEPKNGQCVTFKNEFNVESYLIYVNDLSLLN